MKRKITESEFIFYSDSIEQFILLPVKPELEADLYDLEVEGKTLLMDLVYVGEL